MADELEQPAAPKPFMAGLRTYAVLGTLITVALSRLLSRWLPPDLAKTLAEALSADVLAEVAVGGALLAAWFKARAGKPALPQVVKKAALATTAIMLGCGSAWPATCTQTAAGIDCGCGAVRVVTLAHPSKPRPAGRVIVRCDGVDLPLRIDGEEVR